MKLPHEWPICAVCGTPVQQMEQTWNPSTDEFMFTARCHGQMERTVLSRSWFITGHTINGAMAFCTPQLVSP